MKQQEEQGIDAMLMMLEQATQEKENELLHFTERFKEGQEAVKSFFERMQTEAQEHPWRIVSRVAIYGFGVGIALGARHAAKNQGDK